MPKVTPNYSPPKRGPQLKYPVEEWYEQLRNLYATWLSTAKGKRPIHPPALRINRGCEYLTTDKTMAEYLWKWARINDQQISISKGKDCIFLRLKEQQ